MPFRRLSSIVVACAVVLSLSTGSSADDASALADRVIARPCPPYVLGDPRHRWPWAPVGCDAFTAAALVSTALDDGRPEVLRAAADRLERLAAHALTERSQQPFRSTGRGRDGLARSVLYRGLLLVTLAGLERLAPGGAHAADFDRHARALAADLAASRAGWLPTYAGRIWPCDHAPAASALVLHGLLRHDETTLQAGRALTRRLEALLDRPRGFPTRVDGRGVAVERLPRGTVLAWTAGWLVHGEPATARRFAGTLFRDFCDQASGLAACREWPRGVERGADGVSGPLVGGYGLGASGLALAAARALPTPAWSRALGASAEALGGRVLGADRDRMPFENAIFLWATTARPWLPE